jgi:hypothetical protein
MENIMRIAHNPDTFNESVSIGALRAYLVNALNASGSGVTVDDVVCVSESITSGESYQDLSLRMSSQLANNATFITDIVATFGTWLAHSLGKSDTVYPYAETCDTNVSTCIPLGYIPTDGNKRDLSKALSAILYHAPECGVVERFVSRTYTNTSRPLTYAIVSGVWGMCVHGRLDNIKLVSGDLVFLGQVVDAFDLLDIARIDAVTGVNQLTTDSDVCDVLKQCDMSYWLDEHNFARLRGAAAISNVNDAGAKRFRYELDSFLTRVRSNPKKYNPASVGELTLAQIRRISVLSGLPLEQSNKVEETEIRKILKNMNLDRDLDILVPRALLCAQDGKLDKFWTIMSSRVDGNNDWFTHLSDLLES